jgi:L-threonylcarbamoyladenylate synthase
LVAFPTETVYGLGALATDEKAVKQIFVAKGRPPEKPLIVHVSSREQVYPLVREIPEEAARLMEVFWPGPLTLVMEASDAVPQVVRGYGSTVGVRMPAHPVALALIERAGPLAAPSANLSGRPSPTCAAHVRDDLEGRIAVILDGGDTFTGVESTVLDVSRRPFRILRPGAIPREQLEQVVPGSIEAAPSHALVRQTRPSTAMKVILLTDKPGDTSCAAVQAGEARGVAMAVHSDTWLDWANRLAVPVFRMDPDPVVAGVQWFGILREAESRGIETLLVEPYPEEGAGTALMERVRRCAGVDTDEVKA